MSSITDRLPIGRTTRNVQIMYRRVEDAQEALMAGLSPTIVATILCDMDSVTDRSFNLLKRIGFPTQDMVLTLTDRPQVTAGAVGKMLDTIHTALVAITEELTYDFPTPLSIETTERVCRHLSSAAFNARVLRLWLRGKTTERTPHRRVMGFKSGSGW
jgi:hypothetical protein